MIIMVVMMMIIIIMMMIMMIMIVIMKVMIIGNSINNISYENIRKVIRTI